MKKLILFFFVGIAILNCYTQNQLVEVLSTIKLSDAYSIRLDQYGGEWHPLNITSEGSLAVECIKEPIEGVSYAIFKVSPDSADIFNIRVQTYYREETNIRPKKQRTSKSFFNFYANGYYFMSVYPVYSNSSKMSKLNSLLIKWITNLAKSHPTYSVKQYELE